MSDELVKRPKCQECNDTGWNWETNYRGESRWEACGCMPGKHPPMPKAPPPKEHSFVAVAIAKPLMEQAANTIDRLTRELAEARAQVAELTADVKALRWMYRDLQTRFDAVERERDEARAERDKWHGEWALSRQRECDIGEIERELDTARQALAAARAERDEARRLVDANYRDRDIVWKAAIEECARLLENDYSISTRERLAERMRALASSPDGQAEKDRWVRVDASHPVPDDLRIGDEVALIQPIVEVDDSVSVNHSRYAVEDAWFHAPMVFAYCRASSPDGQK